MKRSTDDMQIVTAESTEPSRFYPSPLTCEMIDKMKKGAEGFGLKKVCAMKAEFIPRLAGIQPYADLLEKRAEGDKVRAHLNRIARYGDPTILNEAYRLEEPKLAALPLLNPGLMRKLPMTELDKHFSAMRESDDTERFIQQGPTLILMDRGDEIAAHDGSIERIVDSVRGNISNSTWAIISEPGNSTVRKKQVCENGSPSLVFNVAEYPITEEVNPNGILLYLEGENITPAVIAKIVRAADIKGALGIHVVVDGEIVCTAPHTLPAHPINPDDLKNYANIIKQEGTFIGNGISSALKGHSQDAHIHTNVGHMIEANGKVFVYVSQAKAEMAVEYASNL